MGYILDQNFLPEKYFEAICQIPHGSYHEKPLSDYLVRFAEQHGLRCRQYENWNVIIYKPGSEGYEEHPPLMLQAHIDMVCEKEDGVTHDFEKDPLSIYVENGELRARGTTLGADDGVGVAYMLSLLEDDRIPHPPLECVFTVQEEVGLIGSRDLVFEDITAKRMIGLDDMGGDTCYVTSCGSQHVSASRDYIMAEPAGRAYRVEVSGLTGGHSGVCISREKGNAIKLTARVLRMLSRHSALRICRIDGGGKDNAIPVRCSTLFTSDLSFSNLLLLIQQMEEAFRAELEFSDPGVTLELSEDHVTETMTEMHSNELIQFLYLFPDGFRHKSMKIPTLTTASENLANIRTENGRVTIRSFARSEQDSYLDQMEEEVRILSDIYGFVPEFQNRAPGWKYTEHSEIRNILFSSYRKVTGREMKPLAEHGGLETGYISGGIPGIDIATFGPRCEGYHTPQERLNLASFRENYEVLKEALSRM